MKQAETDKHNMTTSVKNDVTKFPIALKADADYRLNQNKMTLIKTREGMEMMIRFRDVP